MYTLGECTSTVDSKFKQCRGLKKLGEPCKAGAKGSPAAAHCQLEGPALPPPPCLHCCSLASPSCSSRSTWPQGFQPPQKATSLALDRHHPQSAAQSSNSNCSLPLLTAEQSALANTWASHANPVGGQGVQEGVGGFAHLSKLPCPKI